MYIYIYICICIIIYIYIYSIAEPAAKGKVWPSTLAWRRDNITIVERARHTLGRLHGVRRSVNHV